MSHELADVRIIDTSTGLSGGYCAKMLGDAGADVILLEAAEGHPMRRCAHDQQTSAMFRYQRHGHRSVVALSDAELASGDIIIVEPNGPLGAPAALAARLPHAVVVCISPYGLTGPYANFPWSELVVQAADGSIGSRGRPTTTGLQMGGRVTELVTGAYAAVGALAALKTALNQGYGELVDVSMIEVGNITSTLFQAVTYALRGKPDISAAPPARSYETPSIEPTLDGFVGFNTNTRNQFDAFLLLIERGDLLEDPVWISPVSRHERWEEWNDIVHAWTTKNTTSDIVELAAELRIPCVPVGDAAALLALDHLRERGIFIDDPTGSFKMPRRPWSIDDEPRPIPQAAPTIGQHTAALGEHTPRRPGADSPRQLPLHGVRVLDLTAWWAGPSATAMLAALGADVIHVESDGHPDGIRMAGAMFFDKPSWWELSSIFLQANTNKRGLTLDLTKPRGRQLLLQLAAGCDLVVENFTPRVLGQFDLGWDVIHAANPRAIMMRMPAFGLTGPWKDRPGFAQTMEQLTGLAWMTGFDGDQPRIQRGPCDPNAGMHAAFAAILALQRRERTGIGCLVEVPMVEAALNIAAEPVLEWTAYGHQVQRTGNRSSIHAPQGLYRCAGNDKWVALSVQSDDEWLALCEVVDIAELRDQRFQSAAARQAFHDDIDQFLGAWTGDQSADAVAQLVRSVGVAAEPVRDPRLTDSHPQIAARRLIETLDHPIAGPLPIPGVPFRFASVDHWINRHAPTLGQHNDEILRELAGCSTEDITQLTDSGIISNRPRGY